MVRHKISFCSGNFACISTACFALGFVLWMAPEQCGCPHGATVKIWPVMLLHWNHLQHLICLHFAVAVCLSFIVKREFDLEEIKVTYDFWRKLGNLDMSFLEQKTV